MITYTRIFIMKTSIINWTIQYNPYLLKNILMYY